VLVNSFDAWVDLGGVAVSVSTQRYAPDVLHPDGASRLEAFTDDPWPTWRWRLADTVSLTQEVFTRLGVPGVVVRWRLTRPATATGTESATLRVRPFLSGRDYHALHRENPGFDFSARGGDQDVEWHPYRGVPGIRSRANGRYHHAPQWYRQFLYTAERERGLDHIEDLASPGEIAWDLTLGEAVWVVEPVRDGAPRDIASAVDLAREWAREERARRAAFASRLHRSANQYLVQRGAGTTIVAGYPWFTDWGRDTFVSLRGLCLSTGRLADARDILLEWSGTLSNGMLPNRFPDDHGEAEFNSVDAALWFVVAVHDLVHAPAGDRVLTPADRARLMLTVDDILRAYTAGTRYGICAQPDGLLAAGVPGVQLTWMDAKVGDTVITPRAGKPVEVQALWLNALAFAGSTTPEWKRLFDTGLASFERRFWNDARGCLFDVVDVEHASGQVDERVRPNQIFAVGGLPRPLLEGERARRMVDVVERELVTPAGLRTLAQGEQGYVGRCDGGPETRDRAYHQGTVWPWLMGAFVDAWIRVHGGTPAARRTARDRFVLPLVAQLNHRGIGHLYEIADGDAPHTPRGCPFQAWSAGELLRIL